MNAGQVNTEHLPPAGLQVAGGHWPAGRHHHHSHGQALRGEVVRRPRWYYGRPVSTFPGSPRVTASIGLLDLLTLSETSASTPDAQSLARASVSAAQGDLGEWPSDDRRLFPAQGVLGPIDLDDLGKTSAHEHMIVTMINWLVEPQFDSELPNLPLNLENLGRIRRDPMANRAALVLDDVSEAVEEVRQFKAAGGDTIVDVTNGDFGRDPAKIKHIAEATGLNIIMGSGFYLANAHPPDMDDRTVEDCAAEIIRDVREGAQGTSIRSGIIGEIGCSGSIEPNEEKALRAAAIAQAETGAPVSVHQPTPRGKEALKILDILESEGADTSHVIICHMDHTLEDKTYHKAIAERGCVLEFDRFGNEWYYDSRAGHYEWRDERRLEAIKWLINKGHGTRICIGQDICYRINWTKYGGWGYGHLLKRVEPMFEALGMDERWARRILIDNPREVLAFTKPLP